MPQHFSCPNILHTNQQIMNRHKVKCPDITHVTRGLYKNPPGV